MIINASFLYKNVNSDIPEDRKTKRFKMFTMRWAIQQDSQKKYNLPNSKLILLNIIEDSVIFQGALF